MPFQSEAFNQERDRITDNRAVSLLNNRSFATYDVPRRIDEHGVLRTWEPEFGPTLKEVTALIGAKEKLAEIPNFKLIPKLRRDFSYVSPTIAMPKGLVGRARFNFYAQWEQNGHKRPPVKTRTISGAMIGVKSNVKSAYRLENEAPLDNDLNVDTGLERLRSTHMDTLPQEIFSLHSNDTPMTGLMCVERAGFEATHLLKDGKDAHLISYAGSFDVGTCHDIRYIGDGISSIIANHYETELEIVASRGPTGMDDEAIAQIMEASMDEIQPALNKIFENDAIGEDDPRFIMGKNSRATYEMQQRLAYQRILELNMQPSDLLSRENMRGLTAVFDDQRSSLINPSGIHALSEFPADFETPSDQTVFFVNQQQAATYG